MPGWLKWFLRRFTKYVVNRFTLRSAGRANSENAVLHHRGRKSGRSYVTPVAAEPIEGGFVIPLPYGDDTDWCRNVLVAGRAMLEVRGERVYISNPRLIGLETVKDEIRAAKFRLWTRLGIPQVLRVDRKQSEGRAA